MGRHGMTIERITDKQKPCTYCAQYGHTAWRCPRKPRKPLARSRMKRVGPVTKKWIDTREEWVRNNPPENGYWHCYLQISPYCQRLLSKETLTLDHVKSRTRHPELRFVLENLAPCCAPCNELKGSRSVEELEGTT